MKQVMARITERERAYDDCPLYTFMRDDTVSPWQRVAFMPCIGYWIMSFSDVNRLLLRSDAPGDEIQRKINEHTQEDEQHFLWYLEDLAKLGFDRPGPPSETLRLLWSEATERSRRLVYRLAALIAAASSVERVAIIEVLERGGHGFFSLTAPIARALEAELGCELRFLGSHHASVETGHMVCGELDSVLAIELDEATRRSCVRAVDEVWDLLLDFADELLAYARLRGGGSRFTASPGLDRGVREVSVSVYTPGRTGIVRSTELQREGN